MLSVHGLAVFLKVFFLLGLLGFCNKRVIFEDLVESCNVMETLSGGILSGEGVLDVQ